MLKFLSRVRPSLVSNPLFGFAKFSRDKLHINVGTIGHIDHGKTTLTSAITKVLSRKQQAKYLEYGQIDKAPQEKARGITINTATLEYETQKRHYAHVDCPGHIDYVKNMITGAAKMDAGILVVAATDGPMPQTKQHVLLCRQIGVQTIIVFLNKCDMIKDMEMLEVIEMELKELLKKHEYDPEKVKFVKGSALHAINDTEPELGEKKILELLDVMDNHIPPPSRPVDKPFLMSIEGTYNIEGRGAVATGTVEQGRCKVGDEIELVGYTSTGTKATITGIETFNKTLDSGEAGDNIGVLIRGFTREQLYRGLILAKPKTLTVHTVFEANIYCLKTEEGGRKNPFSSGYRPQLYFRTADSAVQIALPDGVKIAMPGDNLNIKAKLNFPLTIYQGARFALREGGKTIAAGVITKILPENTVIDFGKPKKEKKEVTPGTPGAPGTPAATGAKPGQPAAKPAPGGAKPAAGGDKKDAKSAPKPAAGGDKKDSKPATGAKTDAKPSTSAPKPATTAPGSKPAATTAGKPAATGATGAKPAPAATGAKPAATTGSKPAATSPPKPAATTGAKPAATSPPKPAATTGAKPAATTGAKPATTATGAKPAAGTKPAASPPKPDPKKK